MKRFTQRVGTLLLCGVLMLSVVGPLLALPDKAEAQSGPSAEWIDRTHILVHERVGAFTRDSIYTDSTLDDRYNFKNLNQSGECQSELWVDGPNSSGGDLIVIVTDGTDRNCQLRWSGGGGRDPGDVIMCQGAEGRYLWDRDGYTNPDGGGCTRTVNAGRISLSQSDAADINFRFLNEDTITRVDGHWRFNRQGSGNTFLLDEEGACPDSIILEGGARTVNGQRVRPGVHRERSSQGEGQDCRVDERRDVLVTESEEPGEDGEGGDDEGVGGAGENEPTCESEGGSLSWILCPILYTADAIMRKLDQALIGLLSIPNDYYTNSDLERAWRRMRNIAYLILVPVVLVMVIGTALSFDFISAYTVKRALPRLVIAAIFIALSFEITKFLVVLTNDVGKGIHGLIISAFTGAESISIASVFSPDGGDTATAILSAPIWITALAAGAAAIGSLGIILSYIFVAVIALAIGFFLLSFRQMLIIALMIVAPLAILAWIFPGNDRLWKLWWGTFSKLLLLFPLIMLLIAVGKSFASIVADTDGSFVSTLLKLVAYIGPYFMIPATFKFAGGIFATVSGMANDRSRGLLDRNKAYRQQEIGKNTERRIKRPILEKRADWAGRLESQASKRGRVGAFASRFAANRVGGYNVHAARSAKQAEVAKEINDQIATGRDEDVRGLTAASSYDYYKKHGEAAAIRDGHMEVGADGTRRFKSLGGKMIDEANVKNGMARWGKDRFAQQAAVSYEMRKAQTDDEVNNIATNYSSLAKSWGMNDSQAAGAWIGPAFENQNKHLAFKHMDWKTGQVRDSLATEAYENRGSYNLSQMNARTVEGLGEVFTRNRDVVNSGQIRDKQSGQMRAATAGERTEAQSRMDEVATVSQTFMTRYGGGEGVTNVDDQGQPIYGPPTPQQQQQQQRGEREETYRVQHQGAGHTGQAVRDLAVLTGNYRPARYDTGTHSAGPAPDIKRDY